VRTLAILLVCGVVAGGPGLAGLLLTLKVVSETLAGRRPPVSCGSTSIVTVPPGHATGALVAIILYGYQRMAQRGLRRPGPAPCRQGS